MSIEDTEKASAASAAAQGGTRVSLDDIKAQIDMVAFSTADALIIQRGVTLKQLEQLKVMTICTMLMKNGWVTIGKSAPADPKSYNPELGQKLAYEDCIRQLWPLMGFNLRTKLHNDKAMDQPHQGHGDPSYIARPGRD